VKERQLADGKRGVGEGEGAKSNDGEKASYFVLYNTVNMVGPKVGTLPATINLLGNVYLHFFHQEFYWSSMYARRTFTGHSLGHNNCKYPSFITSHEVLF
jgi:hypothetical protein